MWAPTQKIPHTPPTFSKKKYFPRKKIIKGNNGGKEREKERTLMVSSKSSGGKKNNIKTSSLHDRTDQSQRARRSERKTSIYKNGKGTFASTKASAGGVCVCTVEKSRTVRLMMRVFVFIIARTKKRTTAPLPKRQRPTNIKLWIFPRSVFEHWRG